MTAKMDLTKTWLRVFGCIAFVALGAFLVTRPDLSWKMYAGGALSILFFGFIGILTTLSAFKQGDQLTIDEFGVFDRRATDRPVPWSQIREAQTMSVGFQKFIYLDVGDDPLRFTDSLAKRAYLSTNQSFGRGVLINTHGLTVSHGRVLAELEARLASRQAAGMP